jgi:hypothetical protein
VGFFSNVRDVRGWKRDRIHRDKGMALLQVGPITDKNQALGRIPPDKGLDLASVG